MKEIQLNKGKVAIVDDEDFERLNQFKWIATERKSQGKWYAIRSSRAPGMTSADRKMDRHILDVPAGFVVDHKNGNGLDCRRGNLRLATYTQNAQNKKKSTRPMSSHYKGVSRFSDVWLSKITSNYKAHIIGVFPCQFCAALAYDLHAIELFGEFASPNFLRSSSSQEVTI
jgi:hypothetical protein